MSENNIAINWSKAIRPPNRIYSENKEPRAQCPGSRFGGGAAQDFSCTYVL